MAKAAKMETAGNFDGAPMLLGQARLHASEEEKTIIDGKIAAIKAKMAQGSLFEVESAMQPAVAQPVVPTPTPAAVQPTPQSTAPVSVTRDGYETDHNYITRENYEYLLASVRRYAELSGVELGYNARQPRFIHDGHVVRRRGVRRGG